MKHREVNFKGGLGDTIEQAIVIQGASSHVSGVMAEYKYLDEKFGLRNVAWQVEEQTLLNFEHSRYDKIKIMLLDGTLKVLYFDITDFFGKR